MFYFLTSYDFFNSVKKFKKNKNFQLQRKN